MPGGSWPFGKISVGRYRADIVVVKVFLAHVVRTIATGFTIELVVDLVPRDLCTPEAAR